MNQRMKDILWKQREIRTELSQEDKSWKNQQMMKDIYRRRSQIQLQKIKK